MSVYWAAIKKPFFLSKIRPKTSSNLSPIDSFIIRNNYTMTMTVTFIHELDRRYNWKYKVCIENKQQQTQNRRINRTPPLPTMLITKKIGPKLLLCIGLCVTYSMWSDNGLQRELVNLSNFNQIMESIDTNIPVPSNLNIMMVGDSLTRYQYLSLVHFLQYGKWVDPESNPNMVWIHSHPSWIDFFITTKSLLEPFEQCDCFRPAYRKVWLTPDKIFENRFFLQPSRNNSVSYIQKFGSQFVFKSQWNVTDIHNQHELVRNETDLDYGVYQEKKWTEFIRNFAANMNPKPGKTTNAIF